MINYFLEGEIFQSYKGEIKAIASTRCPSPSFHKSLINIFIITHTL